MEVRKLIEELKKMPQNAQVRHLWDGSTRTTVEVVYLAKNGVVVTSDYDMVCYDEEERPIDAPTVAEDKYWHTPVNPNPYDYEDDEY